MEISVIIANPLLNALNIIESCIYKLLISFNPKISWTIPRPSIEFLNLLTVLINYLGIKGLVPFDFNKADLFPSISGKFIDILLAV